MPIQHHFDSENGILYVTWTGVITASDLSDFAARIVLDPQVTACSRSITNMCDCQLAFTWKELNLPAKALFEQAARRGKKWKTAIVVRQQVQLGVARQHALITENLKETEVFFSEAEARRWVCAESGGPSKASGTHRGGTSEGSGES